MKFLAPLVCSELEKKLGFKNKKNSGWQTLLWLIHSLSIIMSFLTRVAWKVFNKCIVLKSLRQLILKWLFNIQRDTFFCLIRNWIAHNQKIPLYLKEPNLTQITLTLDPLSTSEKIVAINYVNTTKIVNLSALYDWKVQHPWRSVDCNWLNANWVVFWLSVSDRVTVF